MAAKQLVAVVLSDRGDFSRGNRRKVFKYEAYHWGIIILPEQPDHDGPVCQTFEATDAAEIDPVTFRLNNPAMVWWFRHRDAVDIETSPQILGCIIVGRVPEAVTDNELRDVFERITLPAKNTEPQQSCVTWAVDAIRDLQARCWIDDFELGQFKDWALGYADERMKGSESREPKLKKYSVEEANR
jgi:hypothetical protein